MKKAVCILLGMLMLTLTMTACGKTEEEKAIIGTWRHESTYVSVLTFNEDMTCTEILSSLPGAVDFTTTKTGTYQISKGTLSINLNGNLEYLAVVKFEDDKMIWLSAFDDVIYVREK
ncbi:MAG: lipocalin family protein [Huintestinicola sp.]